MTVARLSRDEYDRARRHEYAGPLSELLLCGTRRRYARLGATHWRLRWDDGAGTVLEPVTVEGER